jgi:hypothetical protein
MLAAALGYNVYKEKGKVAVRAESTVRHER